MFTSVANWQTEMQLLNAKSNGEDIRSQLCICLNMCERSHFLNVVAGNVEYSAIIEWDGYSPLPPGWIIDSHGYYRPVINNGGTENG